MAESSNGKQLKYFQLMEDLKEQIISGKIKAGEKLPSENELSQNYQVSRQTVRKALSILQNAGYIYAEHGRGTFCSELLRHTHNSEKYCGDHDISVGLYFSPCHTGDRQCADCRGVQHHLKEHKKFEKP